MAGKIIDVVAGNLNWDWSVSDYVPQIPKLSKQLLAGKHMASIVVDKSFLQGAGGARIHELASEHRLLMSDALFYELLTTKPKVRRQCFGKFPSRPNPVDLVSHIGALMRREVDFGQPSGPPSSNKEQLDFVFNDALTAENYTPPPDIQAAIAEETERLRSAVSMFLEKIDQIPTLFPDLLLGSQAEREKAHFEAERSIVAPQALSHFLGELEPPPGEKPLPSKEKLSDEWALYRWLQVQLLFTLDVYVRYQGNVPTELGEKVYERLEHDVLDAELLALGSLEGAFATRENKHKRWWRLLCPCGSLYE